jgi:hypothetical protein
MNSQKGAAEVQMITVVVKQKMKHKKVKALKITIKLINK